MPVAPECHLYQRSVRDNRRLLSHASGCFCKCAQTHVSLTLTHGADLGGILQGRRGLPEQTHLLLPGLRRCTEPAIALLAHQCALFSNMRAIAPHARQPPKGDKGQNKLTFSNGREDNLTGKCVYFARVNPKGVSAKEVETDVTYGEIVGTPLGSLQSILQDVFQVITVPSESPCLPKTPILCVEVLCTCSLRRSGRSGDNPCVGSRGRRAMKR